MFAATPWSLLTVNRKIPETIAAKKIGAKDYEVVDAGGRNQVLTQRKYLNHVMWSSALRQKFQDGLFTKLVAFYPNGEPHFWSLSPDSNQVQLTTEEGDASVFKIKTVPGELEQVLITTTDEASVIYVCPVSKVLWIK